MINTKERIMANSAENKRSNKKLDFMEKVYKYLNGDEKVELADIYLTKNLIDIFKDVELRQSIDAFFENNLNISETSRSTFMHRNTLLYRIDKIQKLTGLNIRNFNDAVTLLHYEQIYEKTKNIR